MTLTISILSLLFPWLLGWVESRKDSFRIMRWNHTMLEKFHSKYGLLRGLVLLLATGHYAWYHWGNWALITTCLAYQICSFGYAFTSMLNTRRDLPRWYQSREPNASKVDRCFVAVSKKLGIKAEELAGEVYPALLAASLCFYVLSQQ